MDDQQYSSRAERRRQAARSSPEPGGRRRSGAAVLALALLAGGLGYGGYRLMSHDSGDDGAPHGSTSACEGAKIAVAAPPHVARTLTKALAGYHGGTDPQGCARTYSVTTIADADLLHQMTSGSPSAQVWVTDSPTARRQASQVTKTTIEAGAAFASTPVVISTPKDQIAALGSPSTWADVVKASPSLTVGDAATDRASALALTKASRALGDTAQARAALGHLATTTRGSIPTDAPHVTTEAALAQFDAARRAHLAETALQGGSPLVTLSAAPLVSGDPETDAALGELTTYLSTGKGHDAFAAAGYRGGDGTKPPASAPEGANGVRPTAAPPETDIEATLASWRAATKPLRLTTVIDVSGSMGEKVGGVSRIDVVAQTAIEALDAVPASTSIGLWEFSTARQGTQDYKELVPMGPVSSSDQRAKLESAAKNLPSRLGGDTGLYDTLWATFQAAQKDFRNGQVSTVAIITDGHNDDSTGGLTLKELTAKIKGAVSKDEPVDISPIAIGDDVDLAALQEIATLTGGKVYTAKTPQEIPQVLSQSMFDRS